MWPSRNPVFVRICSSVDPHHQSDMVKRFPANASIHGETCGHLKIIADGLGLADVNESNKSFPFIPWPGLVCEWL